MIPGQPLKTIRDAYEKLGLLRELEYLHKRVNEVFSKGQINPGRVLTPAGETGDQTIPEISGTVNFAAGASSLLVRNPSVDKNSIVYAVLRTSDATARLKCVVPGAGFFTIHLTAAATAEVSCGFLVFN